MCIVLHHIITAYIITMSIVNARFFIQWNNTDGSIIEAAIVTPTIQPRFDFTLAVDNSL